ncbi:MAG TPA: hypothetical protein VIV07_02100 [Sphingomicrobium sp.]
MRKIIVAWSALALLGSAAALGRHVETGTPAAMQALLNCRAITDATARLACYDRESGSIAQALQKKDLVVIDQERATQAKRDLFGFSVPSFAGLLGGGALNQIEGTVAGVGQNSDGGLTIKLSDGSLWTQTDDTPVALPPRSGEKVVVSRGTLGSYFMNVGHQPGFKVKRIS